VPELSTYGEIVTAMRGPGIVYLASPYTHPEPKVRQQRFEAVCRAAARLMCDGVYLFSPVAHTHPMVVMGSLPHHFEYWREFDLRFLMMCSSIAVLKLPDWSMSKGIMHELRIAAERQMPVWYLEPHMIPTPTVTQERRVPHRKPPLRSQGK